MSFNLDEQLELLLKKEGLDKFSIYYRDYSTFEEIPLFSKFDRISFLSSLSFNEKNKILINKGIELVTQIRKEARNFLEVTDLDEYLVCLTIEDWDDYEEINCLTTNIFISRKKTGLCRI